MVEEKYIAPKEGSAIGTYLETQRHNRKALRTHIKEIDLRSENYDILCMDYSVERVCEGILNGITAQEIAEDIGIPIYFMMRWLRSDPTRHALFSSSFKDYALVLRTDTIKDVEERPDTTIEASHMKKKSTTKLRVADSLDPPDVKGGGGASVSIHLGFITPAEDAKVIEVEEVEG
jgi:hypothetical protein